MKVVCTICTDQIKEDFCASPCGHTFHFECLSQWLTHQKTCPQCRERCLPRSIIKLFVNSNDLSQVSADLLDPQELQESLSLQKNLLAHKDKALVEAKTSLSEIKEEMKAWQAQHQEVHKKLKNEQSLSSVLKRQVSSMQSQLDDASERMEVTKKLKRRLATLEGVETMLKGSKEDVDVIMMSYRSTEDLTKFAAVLKRDYEVLKEKRAILIKDKSRLNDEVNHAKRQVLAKERELLACQTQMTTLQTDLHAAEEEKNNLRKKVEMLHAAINSPGSRNALQRMLETPMPDHSTKENHSTREDIDLGASPLLFETSRPRTAHPNIVSEAELPSKKPNGIGTKRPSFNREHIVMPISKVPRAGRPLEPKTLSSFVLKKGLKFAPRKSLATNHKK